MMDFKNMMAEIDSDIGQYLEPNEPTTTPSKLDTLQSNKQKKLDKLSNVKTVELYGMPDSDTFNTSIGTIRESDRDGLRYDATELDHEPTGNWYDSFGNAFAHAKDALGFDGPNKSEYAMEQQKMQAARMLGYDSVDQVTEQDLIDVGNWQQIQKLADEVRSEGEERWVAPFIRNAEQVDLTDLRDHEGRGLQIGVDPHGGKDANGRILGSIHNLQTGDDVTSMHARDANLNAFALPDYYDEKGNPIKQPEKSKAGVVNAIKGFTHMFGEGVLNTLDLPVEALEYGYKNIIGDGQDWKDTEGIYDEEKKKAFKEWTGYSEAALSTLGANAKADLEEAMKTGDYWKLAGTLWEAVTTPELAGVSGGFVMGLVLPGTLATKGVQATKGVTKLAEMLQKSDKTLDKATAIAKAEAQLAKDGKIGAGYKIAKILGGNVGFVAEAEQFGRRADAEYAELYGEDPSPERSMANRAVGLLWAKLDSTIAKAIVLGKDPVAKAVPEMIKKLPDRLKVSMAGKIAVMSRASAARVAGTFGMEGSTEAIQKAMEVLAGRYKDGNAGEVLSEAKTDIALDALLGGAGGLQMGAPSMALDAGKTGLEMGIKPGKLTPDQQIKLDAEDKPATEFSAKMEDYDKMTDKERVSQMKVLMSNLHQKRKPTADGKGQITMTELIEAGRLLNKIDKDKNEQFVTATKSELKAIREAGLKGVYDLLQTEEGQQKFAAETGQLGDYAAKVGVLETLVDSYASEDVEIPNVDVDIDLDEGPETNIDIPTNPDDVKAFDADVDVDLGLDESSETTTEQKPKEDTTKDDKQKKDYGSIEAGKALGIIRNIAKAAGIEVPVELEARLRANVSANIKARELVKSADKVEREILVDKDTGVLSKYKEILRKQEMLNREGIEEETAKDLKAEIKTMKSELQGFIGAQKTKAKKLQAGILSVKSMVTNDIKTVMDKGIPEVVYADGDVSVKYTPVTNEEEAVKYLSENYSEFNDINGLESGKDVKYNNKPGAKKFTVNKTDIIKKRLDKAYNKGVYGVLDSVVRTNSQIQDAIDNKYEAPLKEEYEEKLEAEKVEAEKERVEAVGGDVDAVGAKEKIEELKAELQERIKTGGNPKEFFSEINSRIERLESVVSNEKKKLDKLYEWSNETKQLKGDIKSMEAKLEAIDKDIASYKDKLSKEAVGKTRTEKGLINRLKKVIEGLIKTSGEVVEVAKQIVAMYAEKKKVERELKSAKKKLDKRSAEREAKIEEIRKIKKKELDTAQKRKLEKKGLTLDTDKINPKVRDVYAKIKKLRDYKKRYKQRENYKRIVEIQKKIAELQSKLTGTNQTKLALNNSIGAVKYAGQMHEISRETDKSKTLNKEDVPLDFGNWLDTKKTGASKLAGLNMVDILAGMEGKTKEEFEMLVQEGTEFLEANKEGKLSQVMLMESPSQGLLYGSDGKPNINMAAAVAMIAKESMLINAEGLSNPTAMQLAKRFSVDPDQITPEMINMRADGEMRKMYAFRLGSDFMKVMGIVPGKLDEELYSKLVQDIGQVIMGYQINQGWVKDHKIPAEKWIKHKYRGDQDSIEEGLTKLGSKDMQSKTVTVGEYTRNMYSPKTVKTGKNLPDKKTIEAGRKVMKDVLEATAADIGRSGPVFDPIDNIDSTYDARNRVFGDTAEETQDALRVLEDNKYYVNTEAVDKLVELGRDKALKLMGWRSEEETKKDPKLSYFDIETQLAQNMELENSYDNLVELYESENKNNPMWFKWFFSKNGRVNMDSITINPQTDKQLHRFLVSMEEHTVKYKPGKDGHTTEFKYAIGQAFGVAIDKLGEENVDKAFNTILDNFDEIKSKLLVEKEMKIDGVKLEVEHLGHAIQGLVALDKVIKAKGKPVEITLSVEYDGITNGFANKLMQTPLGDPDKMAEWAVKSGLDIEGNVEHIGKAIELGAKGGVVDAYKTLGAKSVPKKGDFAAVKDELIAEKEMQLADVESKDFQINILTAKLDVQEEIYDTALDLMPAMLDENSQVTGFMRNLLKYPFMIFGYAGGLRTIRRNMSSEMAQTLASEMLKNADSESTSKIVEALSTYMGKAAAWKKGDADLLQLMREKPLNEIYVSYEKTTKGKNAGKVYTWSVADALADMFDNTLGARVESVMNSEFGELVQINTAITGMFQATTDEFLNEFVRRIKEFRSKNTYMTEADKNKIIEDLADIFPMIQAPLGKKLIDGILVYESKLMSRDADAEGETNNEESSGIKPTFEGAKTRLPAVKDKEAKKMSIDSMVRTIEKAQKAGAVLPIHFIDGSVMAKLLNDISGGILGIHDAILLGIGMSHKDVLTKYSKHMVDVNKGYSILDEMGKLADRLEKGEPTIETQEAIAAIRASRAEVAKNRFKLYSKPFTLEHMVGPEGSKYEYKPKASEVKGLFENMLEAYGIDKKSKIYDRVQMLAGKGNSKDLDAIINTIIEFMEC
jgi:hypothetical protein